MSSLEETIERHRKSSELTKAKNLIFLAAGLSFLFSIYLFFTGDKLNGIFVGIWVPSILSAGQLVLKGGFDD